MSLSARLAARLDRLGLRVIEHLAPRGDAPCARAPMRQGPQRSLCDADAILSPASFRRDMPPIPMDARADRRRATAQRAILRALPAVLLAMATIPAIAGDVGGAGQGFADLRGVISPGPTILLGEWRAFRERFVAPDGRVIDLERHDAAHGGAQGYGLILAVAARDRATFDAIADFTLERMRNRPGALASQPDDARALPPVRHVETAAADDVLVAKALIKAAVVWNAPRYLEEALPMVHAIGHNLLHHRNGIVELRPAADGSGARHQPHGPHVNLSGYVFGAFRLFALVDDRHPWQEVWQSGLKLAAHSVDRPGGKPPDWPSLAARDDLRPPQGVPAKGLAHSSSHAAIRIPLHMALGGGVPPAGFEPFDRVWNIGAGGPPAERDVVREGPVQEPGEKAYRAVAALVACAARAQPLPAGLATYENSTSFASTLHLLTLSALRAHYPHCVAGEPERRRVAGVTLVAQSRVPAR